MSLSNKFNVFNSKCIQDDENLNINLESWMGLYYDYDLLFDSLNVIPATHNSGAVFPATKANIIPWIWAKCQGYSIQEQLKIGIRCFDLRLKLKRDSTKDKTKLKYKIVHFFESSYDFQQVMKVIANFLNDNPGEIVFVMMKPDWHSRKEWTSEDIDILWDYIRQQDNVLKVKDCIHLKNGITKNLLLRDLRFIDVRGKVLIIPDGSFYQNYNNIKLKNKFDDKTDVDVIHSVKVVYPRFFDRCLNWNAGTVKSAKKRIVDFLSTNNLIKSLKYMQGDKNVFESNEKNYCSFPLIETNVVMWKGIIPPFFACKFMHPFLKKECDQVYNKSDQNRCYKKKMGIVLLDYANEQIIRELLRNNNNIFK